MYCTAGFPSLEDTLTVMAALEKSGADMIELGMPYSDPLADGPVIQHSNTIALQNGMTIKKLFEQLQGFRKPNSPLGPARAGTDWDGGISVPVLLMGYMNPILPIWDLKNFVPMLLRLELMD
jgi:tryptophan synthase alpha chain